MKRSEINTIMRESLAFLRTKQFLLPPFATWTLADWKAKGPESREIIDQQLGWDITDFGSGDFAKVGLFLFTIRNGTFADLDNPRGKSYAEKIMIVREDQLTPTHFHYQKMEDIINRGGGNLVIRLWNSTADEQRADTPVTVSTDGVSVTIPAGGTITLRPGDSVCLPQRNYHRFWGEPGTGTVLVGEVSRVNDDRVDNHFFDPVGRFPEIEEDEEPLYLLYNDYASYYRADGTVHPDCWVIDASRDPEEGSAIRLTLNAPPEASAWLGFGRGAAPYCNVIDEVDLPLLAGCLPCITESKK